MSIEISRAPSWMENTVCHEAGLPPPCPHECQLTPAVRAWSGSPFSGVVREQLQTSPAEALYRSTECVA
jgi:hypothetical protein